MNKLLTVIIFAIVLMGVFTSEVKAQACSPSECEISSCRQPSEGGCTYSCNRDARGHCKWWCAPSCGSLLTKCPDGQQCESVTVACPDCENAGSITCFRAPGGPPPGGPPPGGGPNPSVPFENPGPGERGSPGPIPSQPVTQSPPPDECISNCQDVADNSCNTASCPNKRRTSVRLCDGNRDGTVTECATTCQVDNRCLITPSTPPTTTTTTTPPPTTPPPGGSIPPGVIPRPSPVTSTGACKCDGITPTAFIRGQEVTVTAYAKVEGANINQYVAKDMTFYLTEDRDATTVTRILGPVIIPSAISSRGNNLIRYASSWRFTMPANLRNGVTYRIFADINCARQQAFNQDVRVLGDTEEKEIGIFEKVKNFLAGILGKNQKDNQQSLTYSPNPNVLAAQEDNLRINSLNNAQILENSCTMIRFTF